MDIERTEPTKTFCKLIEEEFGLAIEKHIIEGHPTLIINSNENDIYVYISDGKHYADHVLSVFDLQIACSGINVTFTLIHIARGFFDGLLRAYKYVKTTSKEEIKHEPPGSI